MRTTLTSLQQRFIYEYAKCGNGSKAARLAGYSPNAARQQAYENLQKPHVRGALSAHAAVSYDDIGLMVKTLKELLDSDSSSVRFQALKLLMKIQGIT